MPFGTFLGHVVCEQGVCVDPTKVTVIINMEAPETMKQLRSLLGHTVYYKRFVHNYVKITVPFEKPLWKSEQFN